MFSAGSSDNTSAEEDKEHIGKQHLLLKVWQKEVVVPILRWNYRQITCVLLPQLPVRVLRYADVLGFFLYQIHTVQFDCFEMVEQMHFKCAFVYCCQCYELTPNDRFLVS